MNPITLIVVAFLLGGVILIVAAIAIYNGLVTRRNQVQNAWSQIDVQLKRRFDLVPNLVETVKGYASHERQTLEAVMAARSRVQGSANSSARIEAEAALGGALGRLLAVAEAYPDLKANTNFKALQEELTSTENKIGFARQNYNDETTNYNNALQTFPSNLIAGMFNFQAAPLFALSSEAERAVPAVKF